MQTFSLFSDSYETPTKISAIPMLSPEGAPEQSLGVNDASTSLVYVDTKPSHTDLITTKIHDCQMAYNKHYCLLYRALPVPVEIQKLDAQTHAGVEGATFSLWRVGDDGAKEQLADVLTTDAHGYLKGFGPSSDLTLDELRNLAISDAYDVEKNMCVADGHMYLAPGHYANRSCCNGRCPLMQA